MPVSKFLSEHRLYLHYPVYGMVPDQEANITLADWAKACNDILPEIYSDVLGRIGSEIDVWRPARDEDLKARLSDDLSPDLQKMLGGNRPDLVRRWLLTDEAKRLLSNGDLSTTTELSNHRDIVDFALDFRRSAARRIEEQGIDPSLMRINIKDAELNVFGTGLSYLVVSLDVSRVNGAPITLVELQEAVHAFSRFNSCCWKPRLEQERLYGTSFTLGNVLRALVPSHANSGGQSVRAMTYSFARLADHAKPEELDLAAAFLARRYTTDYEFQPQDPQSILMTEFLNLRHAVSREGVASLLCPAEGKELPQFLLNWRVTSLERVYLPITLMLLHENDYLSQLKARAASAGLEDDDLRIFDEIIDDAQLFRMFYRSSSASDITMHNAMLSALRTVWSLDNRMQEMTDDVNAMAERLHAAKESEQLHDQQRRDFSLYTFGIWSAAALTGLTSFTIVKELHDVWTAPPSLTPIQEWISWLPVAAGFLFAIVSLAIGFTYRTKRPDMNMKKEHSIRAMQLQMIRRARR